MQIQNFSNNQIKTEQDSGGAKLVETLHNKQKLPSLRTYQGDVASAVKDKDESLTSIFFKERKKREETKPVKSEVGFNLTRGLLAVVLLAGSFFAVFSIYSFVKRENVPVVISERKDFLPVSGFFSLQNVSDKNIKDGIDQITLGKGISSLDIFDEKQNKIDRALDFMNLIKVNAPDYLLRNLGDKYMLGVLNDEHKTKFLILETKDFGVAFSGMIDWEPLLAQDLGFLLENSVPEGGEWQDLISKNKDIRALVSQDGQSEENRYLILYTFLSKNIILIANDLSGLENIMQDYLSGLVER